MARWLQSELPTDALAADLVKRVRGRPSTRSRYLEIARLKIHTRELLDRCRIHDLVEHPQYTRQQLLEKGSGIGV
jgi:hypothetical protein